MRTSRIRLGTGVLIPSNRIAPVAANALASLNRLAPGRIVCGIRTGFTARRTMGLGAVELAELREYVRVLRGLLAGEVVEWSSEGHSREIRFLNPELGLIDTKSPIPVYVGAMGPKARAFAAEIGEGWINFAFAHPMALADLRATLEAWRVAGRESSECHSVVFALGCILGEGEPSDNARARARAELRERIGELESAGYRLWVIQLVPGHEQAIEEWGRLLFSG